jgi:hypothetical protein
LQTAEILQIEIKENHAEANISAYIITAVKVMGF